MFQGQTVFLGIGLLLTGLALFLLVWGLLRLVSRQKPVQSVSLPSLPVNQPANDHIVLLVEPGGRLEYLSPAARELFGVRQGEYPGLEALARRIRPSDDFLMLCSEEGETRLSADGRPMDGISYWIPAGNGLLVTLRKPDLKASLSADAKDVPIPIAKILMDFSRSVSVEDGLRATIRAVLEFIERLVPADMIEIRILDPEKNMLTAFRFGIGHLGKREVVSGIPQPPGGYTALLLENQSPLLVKDTQSFTEVSPETNGEIPFRSFMGIPLLAGNELIGTLEIGLKTPDGFTTDDMGIINLVIGQAANAIRSAALLQEEQERAAEFGGLANLAQAIGATRDVRELFNRLVQSLAPLFDVEILGFLSYNEDRRTLEAQEPFIGLPSQFIELYRVTIQPGSTAEEIYLSQETLITENAVEDQTWSIMGLQDVARAASIRNAVLVPLVSNDHSLGYLQVSNHRRTSSFSPAELRLMGIVADQAAAIIENITVVQQTRQRVKRSEALRRIASLASSSATQDEIIQFSLQELARLLQADFSAVLLLDDIQGVLELHNKSILGSTLEIAVANFHMTVDDPQFHLTVTNSKHSYVSGHLAEEQHIIPMYRWLSDTLKMKSIVIVPMITRNNSIGELIMAGKEIDFFNDYDLQIITSAAGQLAIAIEIATLFAQTDESLRGRVDQLAALTRLHRELSLSQELGRILQILYDESLQSTKADCGTILFYGADAEHGISIEHYVGDIPVENLSSLESAVLQSKKSIVVDDFTRAEYQPMHEGVQSALVVPITYRNKVTGLIHLHAGQKSHFNEANLEMIQSLAVQAGIALNNYQDNQEKYRQMQRFQHQADALTQLFKTTQKIKADSSIETAMEILAQGIQEATPFQVVLISLVDKDTGMQQRVAGAGIPFETLDMLKARQQPWSALDQLLKPEFKMGEGFFIPCEKRPLTSGDVQLVTLMDKPADSIPNSWHPEDLLFFPLKDIAGEPVGLISLDAPRDGKRPTSTTVNAVALFAAQAALMIENQKYIVAYRTRAETLSSSLERQQNLLSVSQNHLPILLHKDLEQMIAIRNTERLSRRLRAGLEITEIVNRQVDAPSALLSLATEMLTRLDMSVSLVAENSPEGPRLLHVLGSIPRGTSAETLFGQRNPLRHSLQTGETLLVMNLDEDEFWRETPLLNSLLAKGFISLPIILDEKPIAGILAISPEPMAALTEEDRQVYFQIARQVSIILQNISLLAETRRRLKEVNLLLDFSRQLSGLNPEGIVTSLLESALRVVNSAHAGSAMLWDESQGYLRLIAASGYANSENMLSIIYHSGEALPGRVVQEQRPLRVDEVNFARDYKLPAEQLLHYREATGGRLPVSSLLIPIQTTERVLGVLVLDNFNTSAAFRTEDETLLLSLAQQVSLALENVRLVHASQERAIQLQALTDVSATMTASLKSDELIAGLLEQAGDVLPYDTAILWLRQGQQLSIVAARGFSDNEERIGLTVAVEDSALLAEMVRTSQAIAVGDIRQDARFPQLDEAERLSWLGIPLVYKGGVIGVIALEKREVNFYTHELTQLASTFTNQAAVSLENARLYEESLRRASELDERSKRLALLNRLSSELSGELNEEQVLRLTAEEIKQALSAARVWLITLDKLNTPILRISIPGSERAQPKALPGAPIFRRLQESLGVFSTDDVTNERDLDLLSDHLKRTQSLLVVPLISGNNLRALVFVHMNEKYRFSPTEIELARTICNQAVVAMESARLYQASVSRAEQLATINRASRDIGISLDPEQIYIAIHKAASDLMPAESFVISLLDEEHNEIEGVYLMDPGGRAPNQRLPVGQGLSSKVITSGEPLLIADQAEVDQLGGRTFGEGQPRSIVAVPIIMSGKTIGMLSAQSYNPNVYSKEDQQILSTLANQAGVAVQNGHLFAETRRLADELEQRVIERTAELEREKRSTETLLRILTEASASLDLDRALNRTLALLNETIGAEQGAILMLNPEDNTIQYRAGYGYVTPIMTEGIKPTPLKIGEGLVGWVIQNRKPVLIDDVRKDKRWVRLPLKSPQHRSTISAPLMVGEEVIGAIMVFHRQVAFFSEEQMSLVQAIGNQVAVAINNARLYELIRDQAERLGSMLRNEQVEASRQQAILEAVADGVLVTDPSNEITFLNSSTEKILHFKAQEVIGKPLENFVGLFGKAALTWMNTIHIWSDDPSTFWAGDTYAEQLTLENGRVVLVHLAPVIWRNEFLGTVSIFRDITHEVEVDRLKSEFVATVSHELRTPMTSIKGYVDVLLMGAAGVLTENQTHFLEIVRSNTDRLNILVNDLLDISRIEAGRVALSIQAIDLREVADDVIADVLRRSQEESKPMGLTLDVASNLPRIAGDLERVRQIFGNIVDNSYRYTPPEGQIIIHMHVADGSIQVDIKDNGIGIQPEEQGRVFERFYRGENPLVLATSGTGLGLPIVKQLVEMHRGKIWFVSSGIAGEGSTFSFTLPIHKAEEL